MYKLNEVDELLKNIDSVYGARKCKDVLRNYAIFLKMKKGKNLRDVNYNIFINNRSEYNYYEKVVEIIEKLLKENNIIKTNCRYLKREDIRVEKGEYKNLKKIQEEMLLIDSKRMNIGTYC